MDQNLRLNIANLDLCVIIVIIYLFKFTWFTLHFQCNRQLLYKYLNMKDIYIFKKKDKITEATNTQL